MSTAPTRRKLTAREHAAGIDAASAQRAKYARMLSLAEELGLEYEIERMKAGVDEMDAEVDHLIEQAIDAGFDYDDIEAAS